MTLSRLSLRDTSRGFSLIELAVVVAIIGILAAIAIPTFLGQRAAAQDAAAKSALRNVASEARALAAQRDAAGFPDDLLAQMQGLRGVASFPEDLLGQLKTVEPTYTYAEDEYTPSTGPNDISVGFPLEVAGNGDPDFDKVAFAALSDSGTCWFLTDDLDRGIRYAKDSSEGAADLCYAGRIKLADNETDFDNEDWDDTDPIWFPTIDDPAWPNPNDDDIGAAPDGEDPGGEEPGGDNMPDPGLTYHETVAFFGPAAHWQFNEPSGNTAFAAIGEPDLGGPFAGPVEWGHDSVGASNDGAVRLIGFLEGAGAPLESHTITGYTFEMVFEMEVPSSGPIFSYRSEDLDIDLGMFQSGGGYWMNVGFSVASPFTDLAWVVAADSFPVAGPKHYVVTVDDTNITMYVNGSLFHTEAHGMETLPEPGGSYSNILMGENFSGILDEAAIYPRALSGAQVQALANAAGLAD